MRTRAKILFGAISILLVAGMLAIGLLVFFQGKKYTWNSVIDIEFISPYVSMRLDGVINGESFTSIADNGTVDRTHWEIPAEKTTFTKQNTTINMNLKFTNNANVPLRITISGILIDAKNRFTTYAIQDEEITLPIVLQPNKTGVLTTLLKEGKGSVLSIDLNYVLNTFNFTISGEEATQHLTITIEQDLNS